jgi:hypothetical protein
VSTATTPTGLAVTVTYDGSGTAPTNAGDYAVVATIDEPNYEGSANATLTIEKAPATVAIGDTTQTYDGNAKSVSTATTPTGLAVTVTYDGSGTAPTNAGDYAVVATIDEANYEGSANATLTIEQAVATVTINDTTQTYDGSPKPVSIVTDPANLAVTVTYDGSGTAPTNVKTGGYAVVATIDEANYTGSANDTLTIEKAPLTITADNKSRSYWEKNDSVDFTATFGEEQPPRALALVNGLVGNDTPGMFTFTVGTDANDGDPWDETTDPSPYHTTVTVQNQDQTPASNYSITTKTGEFTITKGSAPTRNAANSSDSRRLVVSGQPTEINLAAYFEDADIDPFGDALVFSNLGDVKTGAGDWTVDFAGRGSTVMFYPNNTTQAGTGEGSPVDITFSVKVTDSANPAVLLDGAAGGVATIYLRLIDNQGPEVIDASPADTDGNIGANDIEQLDIDEGPDGDVFVQVYVEATDEHQGGLSADDGIASIHFEYQWAGDATPTNFDQPVRLGAASATSAQLLIDENSVTAEEGTKLLTVRAIITDGQGVQTTKTWQFTVHNVNVQPTLDDIDGVTVEEDAIEGLTVNITGVTNGGETGDPGIDGTNYSNRTRNGATPGTITAVSLTPTIVEIKSVLAPTRGDFLLTYALQPDANGVATVEVTVDDGTGADNATITKSFTITVNAVNDAPAKTEDPTITGTPHVGEQLTANPGAWNDDKDNAWLVDTRANRATTITYAYQWEATSDVTRPGWAPIDGAMDATFTPTIAQNGAEVRVKVTATDNGEPGTKSTVAYSESVTIANAAPVFAAGDSKTIEGYEDGAAPIRLAQSDGFTFDLVANDGDNDSLTWSVSTLPSYGTATVNGGHVVYTPNADFYNVSSLGESRALEDAEFFEVKVDDGLGGTDVITIDVLVAAVNDAPEFTTLRLVASDENDNPVSTSKPSEIDKIVAQVGPIVDVDDDTFTFGYVWTVQRKVTGRAIPPIDTGDRNELTTGDLGSAFQKDDRVQVTVTVTDGGGKQGYDLPANLSAEKSKEILLGSPAWFPQVSLASLVDGYEAPAEGADPEIYKITFALEGETVVSVIVQVTADKDAPWPAEYLAATWPYTVKGLRWGLTYTISQVQRYDARNLSWVTVPFAAAELRAGEPTVMIEEYDAPSISSDQELNADETTRKLDRLQNGGGDYTGDYEARFNLDSASGYRYTWIGPGTDLEELVLFDADPDGTFPTTHDLSLVMNGITQPGTYTLTVTPLNPEAQFADSAFAELDQEQWKLAITQAEIDENNGTQETPVTDVWGLNPGYDDDDGNGVNDFTRTAPEYVGTLSEDQLGLELALSWNAIPGATKYYLLICNAAGVPLRMYNRVDVGSLPRTTVFLAPGTYQWQVLATSAAGSFGWSPAAWFQIRGVGADADELAKIEARTPIVDGPVQTTVTWDETGTLKLTFTISVGEPGELAVRAFISSGAEVVFDRWLALAVSGRSSTEFSVELGVADGLALQTNTTYSVSLLPRNTVAETTYTGSWHASTVFESGAPAGAFDIEKIGGADVVGGHLVFSFAQVGLAEGDLIDYNLSIKRNGTWSGTSGQFDTGDLDGDSKLTLPEDMQFGDFYVVLLRVYHDGAWTNWRIFSGTVAGD